MILSFVVFLFNFFLHSFFINLCLAIGALVFTLRSNLHYFYRLNTPDKQLLSLYPVLLFYVFICLFISMVWRLKWSIAKYFTILQNKLSFFIFSSPVQKAISSSHPVCFGFWQKYWNKLLSYFPSVSTATFSPQSIAPWGSPPNHSYFPAPVEVFQLSFCSEEVHAAVLLLSLCCLL